MPVVVKVKDRGTSVSICRIGCGMSVKALSEKTGISKAAIYKLENGLTETVRPTNAKRISEALGAEFDKLFLISKKGE